MNQFMADYIERLRRILSDEDVVALYHWFWDNQEEVRRTAGEINASLRLQGDYALKPDLPCLTMGSRTGLLFLLVNPGWSKELNQKEDDYCRKSRDAYVDLMFNYFIRSPDVLGARIRYAANMISFVGALREGLERFGRAKTAEERWKRAQESNLIGHWEIFPFHSAKDGLTEHTSQPWLSCCIKESILAALRLQPELLLVMSPVGWNILRNDALRTQQWSDDTIGKPPTRLSYTVTHGTKRETEIVAVRRQVLSTPRICKNQAYFDKISHLRRTYPFAPSEPSARAFTCCA